MKNLRIGCVIMAAGNSTRFGQNKLTAVIGGKQMIKRTFAAITQDLFSCVVVVTQYDEIEAAAKAIGFKVVRNDRPELGASHTVRLGTEALSDCDAICFLVADQPLLRRESIASLVALYRANGDCIAAVAHDGRRGNPCIFPRRFFAELSSLEGDCGGRGVIRRHEDSLVLLEISSDELIDVDTPEMLKVLKDSL